MFGVSLTPRAESDVGKKHKRQNRFLTQKVFNSYHSENDFTRYLKRLERKDLSLVDGMIPLGSCTMKLNAAVQMRSLVLEKNVRMHPFCPVEQASGHHEIMLELQVLLAQISGFAAFSLQPKSVAQ